MMLWCVCLIHKDPVNSEIFWFCVSALTMNKVGGLLGKLLPGQHPWQPLNLHVRLQHRPTAVKRTEMLRSPRSPLRGGGDTVRGEQLRGDIMHTNWMTCPIAGSRFWLQKPFSCAVIPPKHEEFCCETENVSCILVLRKGAVMKVKKERGKKCTSVIVNRGKVKTILPYVDL